MVSPTHFGDPAYVEKLSREFNMVPPENEAKFCSVQPQQGHAHYFQTHRRRMLYLEFREADFPIGSGDVESGIKQFKARLSGAGSGAQRMLTLRAAALSHTFDDLWDAA